MNTFILDIGWTMEYRPLWRVPLRVSMEDARIATLRDIVRKCCLEYYDFRKMIESEFVVKLSLAEISIVFVSQFYI